MKIFHLNVNKYDSDKNFVITTLSSLIFPKDNSVMFITKEYLDKKEVFLSVNNCLIFWPLNEMVLDSIKERHAVVFTEDPRTEFAKFFNDNNIDNELENIDYNIINGAFISKSALIGTNCKIHPGVYIDSGVKIGDNVIIEPGVKLLGNIYIGNNVKIKANSVIGADGLTTNRSLSGESIDLPQFGGVEIHDRVYIGANTVIARGAIDNTVICEGAKIDNLCFISHNVYVGKHTFIVGETIMFGSSSIGDYSYVSGNSTIRNGVKIGNYVTVGMGSVVTKNVDDGLTVFGSPAKPKQ